MKTSIRKAYFCSCGTTGHIVTLTAWEDEREGYLDVNVATRYGDYGIIEKIKHIWAIICGDEYDCAQVILNPENVDQLIDDIQFLAHGWKKGKLEK